MYMFYIKALKKIEFFNMPFNNKNKINSLMMTYTFAGGAMTTNQYWSSVSAVSSSGVSSGSSFA